MTITRARDTVTDTGEHCLLSGKRCFSSASAARKGMRNLPSTLRVYRCDMCRKFHITHERGSE